MRDMIKSSIDSVRPSMTSQEVSNFARQITDVVLNVVRQEMQPLQSIVRTLENQAGDFTDESPSELGRTRAISGGINTPVETGMTSNAGEERPALYHSGNLSTTQPHPGPPSVSSDHYRDAREGTQRFPFNGDPSSPSPLDDDRIERDELFSLSELRINVPSMQSSDTGEDDIGKTPHGLQPWR